MGPNDRLLNWPADSRQPLRNLQRNFQLGMLNHSTISLAMGRSMYGGWAEMLKESAKAFGDPPRSFGFLDRWNYLRIPSPPWINDADVRVLKGLLAKQKEIFKLGSLVWGHIVQANSLLFEPGKDNCPALVVYAPDPERQMDPLLLQEVASKAFDLKGTEQRDPDKRFISELLADESKQPMGVTVPRSICSIGNLLMTCTFCARHHFPTRKLSASIFPMVRHGTQPQYVLPLPERYWAPRLTEWWNE